MGPVIANGALPASSASDSITRAASEQLLLGQSTVTSTPSTLIPVSATAPVVSMGPMGLPNGFVSNTSALTDAMAQGGNAGLAIGQEVGGAGPVGTAVCGGECQCPIARELTLTFACLMWAECMHA